MSKTKSQIYFHFLPFSFTALLYFLPSPSYFFLLPLPPSSSSSLNPPHLLHATPSLHRVCVFFCIIIPFGFISFGEYPLTLEALRIILFIMKINITYNTIRYVICIINYFITILHSELYNLSIKFIL